MSDVYSVSSHEHEHVAVVERDQDGTWFSYCRACSFLAGSYVIECREGVTPWPPFLMVEAPPAPAVLNAGHVAQLSETLDEELTPGDLLTDLRNIIEHAITNRPRSLQRTIGPSEIGGPCGRKIAYKLTDAPAVNLASMLPAWRPQVGVFVHAGLAEWLENFNANFAKSLRFLVERRVIATTLTKPDGSLEVIDGSADLFDIFTGIVLDWKIVGPNTLKKVKAKVQVCYRCPEDIKRDCVHTGKPRGAEDNYRIQGQVYGKGFADMGFTVRWIVVAFLPSAGDLSDAFFHIEPFDPGMAKTAIDRLHGTQAMLNTLPLETVLKLTPTADFFCQRCEYFKPDADTLAEGCPGHEGRRERQDSLFNLIPPGTG